MKVKPDYIIPLNNNVDIKEMQRYLAVFSDVKIPDKPLSKQQIGTLLTKSLLNDLHSKGYDLKFQKEKKNHYINVCYPDYDSKTSFQRKDAVRQGHIMERDSQLLKKSNQDFIRKIETMRLFNGKWISIYNLMADGKDLSNKIKSFISSMDNQDKQDHDYDSVMKPYIQFVSLKEKCKHTGLNLNDIWRYFRHTWSLEYKSLPGRSIRILIRDESVINHPVIGIAALGSSIAQQTVRDEMLGWSQNSLSGIIDMKASWYNKTRERLLDSIKYSDLVNKDFSIEKNDNKTIIRIKKKEISNPNIDTIKNLNALTDYFMDLHHSGQKSAKKINDKELMFDKTWNKQSQLPLFVAKRCRALKIILEIDSNVHKKNKHTYQVNANNYKKLLRQIKAEKVGIDLMDIIICGAIPPYNELLSGKLVAMLLTSPEVIDYVRKKYERTPSIIASSIKGKAFFRKPNLVFLGTTSLYGKGLSQYTRISIPSKIFGDIKSKNSIKYKSLGETLGFGNYHISKKTIELARLYNERISPTDDSRAPRVKYIFGEGINPLFRMISGALNKLGFPSVNILKHKNARAVYGVSLIENMSEYLLGVQKRPKYLSPQTFSEKRTKQIFYYWAERWMSKRIKRKEVLDNISKHTLEYPIKHGAKVKIPNTEDYGPLFE